MVSAGERVNVFDTPRGATPRPPTRTLPPLPQPLPLDQSCIQSHAETLAVELSYGAFQARHESGGLAANGRHEVSATWKRKHSIRYESTPAT